MTTEAEVRALAAQKGLSTEQTDALLEGWSVAEVTAPEPATVPEPPPAWEPKPFVQPTPGGVAPEPWRDPRADYVNPEDLWRRERAVGQEEAIARLQTQVQELRAELAAQTSQEPTGSPQSDVNDTDGIPAPPKEEEWKTTKPARKSRAGQTSRKKSPSPKS